MLVFGVVPPPNAKATPPQEVAGLIKGGVVPLDSHDFCEGGFRYESVLFFGGLRLGEGLLYMTLVFFLWWK